MLIGIHDKNCSLRAVAYVMKQYPKGQNLDVTFVHVFPNWPAMYWDDGHLLNSKEKRGAQERDRHPDGQAAGVHRADHRGRDGRTGQERIRT